jgi:hypothetical protein
MRRTRRSLWIALCLALILALGPAAPVFARASLQEEVANRIADIRAVAPGAEDLFEVDNGTWDVGYTGDTSTYYKGGRLHVSVENANTIAWSQGSTAVGDFYAEVDTQHADGSLNNQLGLIFRYVDTDNFYFFAISSDGYYSLQKLTDNEWSMLVDWTATPTVETGEGMVNTVGLLVEGNTFTLLINDYIVDEATDDSFAGGTLALTAGAFDEPPVDIAFDNFAIWLLGEAPTPEPSVQLPVRVPDRPRTPTPAPEEITPTATPEGEDVTATPAPEEVTVTPAPEEITATPAAQEEITPTVTAAPEEVTVTPVPEEITETPVPEEVITATVTAAPEVSTVTPVPEEVITATVTAAPEEVTTTPVPEEVTVTATPEEEVTATPTPAEEVGILDHIEAIRATAPVYTQDFAALPADWTPHVTDDMRYDVVDGVLEFGIDIPGALGWTEVGPASNNLYVELDGLFLSDVYAEYGILFRYVDTQNFYFLAVDSAAQYSIWRLRQNQWEPVLEWTYTDYLEIGPDGQNRIGLLVEGERFTVLANGVVVGEVADDAFPTGALALAVGTFEEGAVTVHLDNLAVWALDENAARRTAPVIETPPVEETPMVEEPGDAAAAIAAITAEDAAISDDFRRDQGYWTVEASVGATYEYSRRALHIMVSDPNWLAMSTLLDEAGEPAVVDNFYAEVDLSFAARVPSAAVGMLVRYQDDDNFYYAAISENGYFVLQKKEAGVWSDVIAWTADTAVDTSEGAINRFGVLANGETIALTVNDTVVGETTDSSFADGQLALMAQTFGTADLDAAFDNFDLWLLAE